MNQHYRPAQRSGNYYLTDDVNLPETWQVPSGEGVKPCLNGKTVTGPDSGSVIKINSGRSLSLYDESGGQIVGGITNDNNRPVYGGGVYVNGGTFNMTAGTIQNCFASNCGGGVYVHNNGSFTMNSGTIQICSDTSCGGADNRAVFSSVVVVTDRTVLDAQLQDTISGFDHTIGAVETIGEDKNSKDLRDALNNGARIIVTTLQKFPVIYQEVDRADVRNFAVIVDEASACRDLRLVMNTSDHLFLCRSF